MYNWGSSSSFLIVVPTQTYQWSFSIENKYDQRIFIKTTLPEPYNVISINGRNSVTFNLSTSSSEGIELEAYDYANSEPLTINNQFKVQLLPQTGSSKQISLVVPSLEYSK